MDGLKITHNVKKTVMVLTKRKEEMVFQNAFIGRSFRARATLIALMLRSNAGLPRSLNETKN